MRYLAQPVHFTRRALFVMLALSGYAVGTIIVTAGRALGF